MCSTETTNRKGEKDEKWSSYKLYKLSWIHWERLQLLADQMQSSGTRDNFDIGNTSGELNDEFSEIKVNIQSKAKLKHKMSKKGLEEKKMEVLEECLHMLTSCMSSKKVNLQQNL